MKKHTANNNDLETLAADTRALLAATADVAEEKVMEARKRITAVLDQGKEFYGSMRDKTIESAHTADQTIRDHPYQAIGLAFGLGALIGCLIARRNS